MSSCTYPRLIRRVRAILIDGVIFAIGFYIIILGLPALGAKGVYVVVATVLLLFFFEPFLVSLTGGTIGHHINRIRVQSIRSGRKLDIFRAVFRFILKALLGWVSFFTVFSTVKYQAIHDIFSGSVVVLKHPEKESERDVLSEKVIEDAGYSYPARVWRFFIFLAYVVASFVALCVLNVIVLTSDCLLGGICTTVEEGMSSIFAVSWIVFVAISFHYCWRCRIWGCRRKKIHDISKREEPSF